jgi:uncharacterized protein YbjT (DUF2867 family)
MKAIVFGATGMVGQGVLRECLRDPAVESVLTVGRKSTGVPHPKLREIARDDLWDYSALEAELTGFDACFFCLGVTSVGMGEAEYDRITRGIAVAAGECLARRNPGMTFVFVSGTGADGTEKGRVMWARVKGKAENALMRMPFKAVYVFRPALIQPVYGVESRTRAYRVFYVLTAPVLPALLKVFPRYVTTTERIGRAMLRLASEGFPKRILETADINAAASGS